MKQKVKITKQQIKEDKFTTAMLQTRDWILDHWQPVALAAAAVIIIIVGIAYYASTQESRDTEGANRLSAAISELRRDNYQAAIVELNDIADQYGGEIAASATFHLANAYFRAKNYDEALAEYQKYYDKYHRNKLLAASALGGIAACYESKQQFEAAATGYMEAYNYYPKSPNAPEYLLGAVRNYVSLGDQQQANEIVGMMKDEFSDTAQYRDAVMLSMKLKS